MLTNSVGIGLRDPHYHDILLHKPAIGWLEAHSENFFHEGGATLERLLDIRKHYPISLHGVGLSLGSAGALDTTHLARLARLIDIVEPCFVSEHLSWSRLGNVYFPDLFPLPDSQQSRTIYI